MFLCHKEYGYRGNRDYMDPLSHCLSKNNVICTSGEKLIPVIVWDMAMSNTQESILETFRLHYIIWENRKLITPYIAVSTRIDKLVSKHIYNAYFVAQ